MLAVGATLAALSAVGPASAAIGSSPWWWDTYDVAAAHAAGFTGAGIKVAVLDEAVNPDLPVFAGRDLTVADGTVCAEGSSAVSSSPTSGAVHGSTITATIIGNGEGAGGINGIAPEASVTFYGWGRTDPDADCTPAEHPDELSPWGVGLQRAIDDGADIFTTSVGAPSGEKDYEVIANALAKGVVIIDSTTNPGSAFSFDEVALDTINGVVAVAAVDRSGELQRKSDGEPYVTESTTVVASGVDLPTVGRTGTSWDESVNASGSSFSAPIVAGMLALVAQRYPDATGDQLVQSLIHNTNGTTHEPTYEPSSGYGYGAAWLTSTLADDPTAYPDESPIMNRPEGVPTAEHVEAAAARGSAYPSDADPALAPTETSAPAPAPAPAPESPLGTITVIVLLVLGLLLVAGIVTTLIVVTRKKRNPRGGTP